jgi:hypothetical protein
MKKKHDFLDWIFLCRLAKLLWEEEKKRGILVGFTDEGYVVNENEAELQVNYAGSETEESGDSSSENSEIDLCTDESLDEDSDTSEESDTEEDSEDD